MWKKYISSDVYPRVFNLSWLVSIPPTKKATHGWATGHDSHTHIEFFTQENEYSLIAACFRSNWKRKWGDCWCVGEVQLDKEELRGGMEFRLLSELQEDSYSLTSNYCFVTFSIVFPVYSLKTSGCRLTRPESVFLSVYPTICPSTILLFNLSLYLSSFHIKVAVLGDTIFPKIENMLLF